MSVTPTAPAHGTELWLVLTELQQRATAALSPTPGRSQVVPGMEVAWDDCCGQLSVRVLTVTPRYGKVNASGAFCAVYDWTVQLGVGIVRCVSTVDDRGNAPTAAKLTAEAAQMVADMAAIQNALLCTDLGAVTDAVVQVQLGEWTPSGPNGGCAGGEWAVTLRMNRL